MEKYIPSYGWIIKKLVRQNAEDFTSCWKELVNILCYSPWMYFCVKRQVFDTWKYKEKLNNIVCECMEYDSFLEAVFVNRENKKIIHCKGGQKQAGWNQEFCTIFEYWEETKEKSFFDFYAFCFDQCFALLIYCVQSAYLNIDDYKLYSKFLSKAHSVHEYLKRIFSRLRFSEYKERYDIQLRRYQSVLAILSKEKKHYDHQAF